MPAHRQPLRLEGTKSIGYVNVPVQRCSQRSRVLDCLDDGAADVGTCEHCCITDQCDSAEGKRGAFKVVDRLQERPVHEAQRSGDFRRQQARGIVEHFRDHGWSDECRRNGELVRAPGDVRQKPGQRSHLIGRAVPDDVPAPMAGAHIVVGSGNGISQQLFAGWEAEDERSEDFGDIVPARLRSSASPRHAT